MLANAPLGIIVCGDLDAAHDRQLSYLLQDCSAAVENLFLAAHLLGLGACWLGMHPRRDRVKSLKEIFRYHRLSSPLPVSIGNPGETKGPHSVYYPDRVHSEAW